MSAEANTIANTQCEWALRTRLRQALADGETNIGRIPILSDFANVNVIVKSLA